MIRRERRDGGEAREKEDKEKRGLRKGDRERQKELRRRQFEEEKEEHHHLPQLVVQLLQDTVVLLRLHEFPTRFCSKALQHRWRIIRTLW